MNFHRLRTLASFTALLSTPMLADAQASDALTRDIATIKSEIFLGRAMVTLQTLADQHSPRLTGSPEYQAAAEWAAEQFRAMGIRNVRLEPFNVTNGWHRGSASGAITAPVTLPLHLESVGWSPPTPEEGISAEAIWVSDISTANIAALAPRIADHVVLLDLSKLFTGDIYAAILNLQTSYPHFKEAGALAILMPNSKPNNILGDWVDMLTGGKVLPLPIAEVGMEDAQLIQRLLERSAVKVRFQFSNHVDGPIHVPNVIAEIRGSEKPNEWILIGGHLDSWDYGTGAQDNGTGSVTVIEIARVFSALHKAPRRSIRFALWGGEEPGLLGSFGYARAHRTELPQCRAVLNTDTGAGRASGWRVDGREDVAKAFAPIRDLYLRDLGANDISLKTTCDTDHCAFMLEGVPVFDLAADLSAYEDIHHRSSDTFDKVDQINFKASIAVVAVTAYAIAQSSSPIGRQIAASEVASILNAAGLDTVLSRLGRWQP